MNLRKLLVPTFALGLLVPNTLLAAGCGDEDAYTFVPSGSAYQILDRKRVDAYAPDNEHWLEDHCGSGLLFKVGDGTIKDPRREIGTWSANARPNRGGPVVTYNYGPGGEYRWFLYVNAQTDPDTGEVLYDDQTNLPLTVDNFVCWERRADDGVTPLEVIAIGEVLTSACP